MSSDAKSRAKQEAKAALELTLKLIERRVTFGKITREQADLERRRLFGL